MNLEQRVEVIEEKLRTLVGSNHIVNNALANAAHYKAADGKIFEKVLESIKTSKLFSELS